MSRKAFIIGFIIFFLGISTGAFIVSRFTSSSTDKPVEISSEATSAGTFAGTGNETARVKRVIDGDTIELVDGRKVRYIGIDTPETVDPRKPVGCFGREASAKNREFVENMEVELEKDISETDQYGRLLRYVYVEVVSEGKVMVNEELVREGFAQNSTFPPDVKYQDLFIKAEIESMAQKRGLWGSCMQNSPSPSFASSQAATEVKSAATSQNQTQNTTSTNNAATTQSPASDCTIKGNISNSGEKIYHVTGCGSYDKTAIDESKGERWFCTEEEAVAAGWRKAKNC